MSSAGCSDYILELLKAGRQPTHRPHLALGVYIEKVLYINTDPDSVPRCKVKGHLIGCYHVVLTLFHIDLISRWRGRGCSRLVMNGLHPAFSSVSSNLGFEIVVKM